MPVTLKPDGSLVFDTAADLIQYQREIRQQGISPAKTNGAAILSNQFLETLVPHKGKSLSSEELAKVLKVDTPSAIGPKMRYLKRILSEPLETYLERTRNREGAIIWRVK